MLQYLRDLIIFPLYTYTLLLYPFRFLAIVLVACLLVYYHKTIIRFWLILILKREKIIIIIIIRTLRRRHWWLLLGQYFSKCYLNKVALMTLHWIDDLLKLCCISLRTTILIKPIEDWTRILWLKLKWKEVESRNSYTL